MTKNQIRKMEKLKSIQMAAAQELAEIERKMEGLRKLEELFIEMRGMGIDPEEILGELTFEEAIEEAVA